MHDKKEIVKHWKTVWQHFVFVSNGALNELMLFGW